MALIPSMLSQKFRTESGWLQRFLRRRRWLTDGNLRSAKWIRSSSSARVLSACMHRLSEALDLFEHAFCCGSLGSYLLLLELKLHLNIDVGVRLCATLAPGVRSLIRASTGTELRERI